MDTFDKLCMVIDHAKIIGDEDTDGYARAASAVLAGEPVPEWITEDLPDYPDV